MRWLDLRRDGKDIQREVPVKVWLERASNTHILILMGLLIRQAERGGCHDRQNPTNRQHQKAYGAG